MNYSSRKSFWLTKTIRIALNYSFCIIKKTEENSQRDAQQVVATSLLRHCCLSLVRDREDGLGGESERKGREWEDQRDHDRGRVRESEKWGGGGVIQKVGGRRKGRIGEGEGVGGYSVFLLLF